MENKDRHPRLSSDPHVCAVAFPTCIHTSYIHMRETDRDPRREILPNYIYIYIESTKLHTVN